MITPIVAENIAKAGWSKLDVQKFLFDHARYHAWEYDRYLRDWTIRGVWSIDDDVQKSLIPKLFRESDDPNRMVPIVWEPKDIMIVVSGDPLRNNAYVFAHNGFLGFPVAKKINLPADWQRMLKEANT